MTHPPREMLVELAFARANGEDAPSLKSAEKHAATCGPCRELLSTYLRTIEGLREVYAEGPERAITGACLDDNAFAAYLDGALSPEERDAAERHIAWCARCLEQLVECHDVAAEVARAAKSVLRYAIGMARDGLRILAHPETGFTPVALEPVPVLGPETPAKPCAWRQSAGSFTLEFTLTPEAQGAYTLALTLRGAKPGQAIQVVLRREGALRQARPLPPSASLRFDNLAPGPWQLELIPPERAEALSIYLELPKAHV